MRKALLLPLALAADAAAAQPAGSVAPRAMHEITPGLAGYTDDVLFGDVWKRPGLAPRDRSLITLAVLVATGKTGQLPGHLGRALDNGVTPHEISGLLTHLAFYSGWPSAVSALEATEQAFRERKIDTAILKAGQLQQKSAGNDPVLRAEAGAIAGGAGGLAELTSQVIAGDLWLRSDLAPRDRSLVTIAMLAATGERDGLAAHLRLGEANGLTRAELGEAVTHLAFYAGWPKAAAAAGVLTALTVSAGEQVEALSISRAGSAPSRGPATNFTGTVTVSGAFRGSGGARLAGATVRFEPGARSHWHSHTLGQLIVVTQGRGHVQADGGPIETVGAGDVVWTPPGVRHWHGASADQAMIHVAMAENVEGQSVQWLGPVSNAQYAAAARKD